MPPPRNQAPLHDADIEYSATYVIHAITAATKAELEDRLRPQGITIAQWCCMYVLYDHPGLSAAELGRRVFVSRQAIRKTVKQLRERGWVMQEQNGTRLGVVHLTAAGRGVLEDSLPAMHNIEQSMLDVLTPAERDQFTEMLLRCGRALGTQPEANASGESP